MVIIGRMANAQQIEVAIRHWPGDEDLPLPQYQSKHAAGMDLHAAVNGDCPKVLEPGAIALVPCGFAIALPDGYEAQVRPRSGLATKQGVTLINSPGTIDADYRGQVMVPLINLGPEPVTIERGMRIAQMIIAPVSRVQWRCVEQLPDSDRGDRGFGHTGQ